jgi:fluoride ion exporter CrcB/FEX
MRSILLAGLGGFIGSAARYALGVGVLGGFTTFSSFSYDTLHLWRESGAGRLSVG